MSALVYHISHTKLSIPVADTYWYDLLCKISLNSHMQLLLLLLKLLLLSTLTVETDISHRIVMGLCKRIWSVGTVCRNRICSVKKNFPYTFEVHFSHYAWRRLIVFNVGLRGNHFSKWQMIWSIRLNVIYSGCICMLAKHWWSCL